METGINRVGYGVELWLILVIAPLPLEKEIVRMRRG